MANKDLLIYDGDCGFCQASAEWLLKKDRRGEFEAVAAQRCPRPPMSDELLVRSRKQVLLAKRDGTILGGADAIFAMLSRCGWGIVAKILGAPPLIWIMRAGYVLVANNRHRISKVFLKGQSCKIDVSLRPSNQPPAEPPSSNAH